MLLFYRFQLGERITCDKWCIYVVIRRGESTIGLLTCMCKLMSAKSSCDETADKKDVLDTECESDESNKRVSCICNELENMHKLNKEKKMFGQIP